MIAGHHYLPRYDLKEVAQFVSREDFGFRVHSLWRFRGTIAGAQSEKVVTLFEGFTPLISADRADLKSVYKVYIKR